MTADPPPVPRGLVFGAVADQYDQYRPGYPMTLLDDVVSQLPGPHILEVGGGTGKATTELTGRGLHVTVVEPDPAMAAILAVNCPEARIVVSPFESFQPDGVPAPGFDGLVSAQAWHWTDPPTRADRAAAMLRPGGLIALWWNRDVRRDDAVYRALDAVYADHGVPADELPYADAGTPEHWPAEELRAHPLFGDVEERSYESRQAYPAARYSALLATTSHHRILQPAVRESLQAAITATVEAHGGRLTLDRRTDLCIARRLPR